MTELFHEVSSEGSFSGERCIIAVSSFPLEHLTGRTAQVGGQGTYGPVKQQASPNQPQLT